MRLFVAVHPGERFQRELSRRLDGWRARLPLAWVRPDNLHVTLRFLGELPVASVPPLAAALREAAAGQPSFLLRPGGAGAFPHLRAPRVLFLHLESGGALERLAAAVRAATDPCLPPERRDDQPFRAHLTLARIREPLPAERARQLAQIDAGAWDPLPVADVRLVSSVLARGGSIYTDEAVVPLASPAAPPAPPSAPPPAAGG